MPYALETFTATFNGHVFNSLSDLEGALSKIYAGNIGYEVFHVGEEDSREAEREWLFSIIESMSRLGASPTTQRRMGEILQKSEHFDRFMARRFGHVKRYGLEGGESMMVAIDAIFQATQARTSSFTLEG